jgi:threonine/homoserine/homoserine lactone efflux protein
MIAALLQGLVLGLSAGFAPGPLLTLVISESLRHGGRAGVRAALAPAVTDAPIIALTMFLLSRLSHVQPLLGILSLLGSLFVLFLAWENFTTRGIVEPGSAAPSRSLQKGILVNFLSPHPYIFWLTVGGPITWLALEESPLHAALFVGTFYTLLLGSKIVLALLTDKARPFLTGPAFLAVMRILAAALCLLALLLMRDGLQRLGLL